MNKKPENWKPVQWKITSSSSDSIIISTEKDPSMEIFLHPSSTIINKIKFFKKFNNSYIFEGFTPEEFQDLIRSFMEWKIFGFHSKLGIF